MKKKFWIKTRIFLGFWFFIIAIINIILYILYLWFEKTYISSIKEKIWENYKNIKKIIDKKNNDLMKISPKDVEELKDLWFFLYFWKNSERINENYQNWFYIYWNNLIFKGDYKWNNILIWKNIFEFLSFKWKVLELIILADIIWFFIVFTMIYFITNRLLKPLLELSKKISEYDIEKNKEKIENIFWDSEIWLISDSINNLICKSKKILENQKRFIQDSSHELKTPLMQIDSNIEIIEEKVNDEKIKKRIESIKESSENINKIVSNLSFIIREENNLYKKEKININNYLKKFINSFRQDAKNKKINIKIVDFWVLEIENNIYFLDRLFGNLLQNSIFYNKWNSDIFFEIYEKKVILKDKWIWIWEDELEKIFDRFYRNSDSNIYNSKWNGLWLTIVKKICDDFWWGLNIKSEIWKWSQFEIIFEK